MNEEAAGEQPHILVVDDDTRLRDLLQRYLRDQGFRVTTAVDAADARAKLAALAFDLLVLDIMMPGETGLQLTETLRRESTVPILLLTAMSETENRIAGFERSEEHTSELQSLMRISYAVFCLKKTKELKLTLITLKLTQPQDHNNDA